MIPERFGSLPPIEHREVPLVDGSTLLAHRIAGPTGAPTTLLLHGWTVTGHLNFFTCLEPLSRDTHVIWWDHRGHGDGPRTRGAFRMEDCADDVLAVADAFGVERFGLVGYSMGGAIAQLVWRLAPERVERLALAATAASFTGSRRSRIEFATLGGTSKMARLVPRRAGDRILATTVRRQTKGRGYDPWIIEQISSGDLRLMLSAGRAIGRFDSSSWARDIDVPTGIVVTASDTVVSPVRQRVLAGMIGHADVNHVGGDHDVIVRNPGAFVPRLLDAVRHGLGSDMTPLPKAVWIVLGVAAALVIVGLVTWQLTGDDADDLPETATVTGETIAGDDDSLEIPPDAIDRRGEAAVEISVVDNEFDPVVVVISPGTEITWVNNGRNDHNVIPDDGEAFARIETADLASAASASRAIDTLGDIPYHCSIHGAPGVGQVGTLVVG